MGDIAGRLGLPRRFLELQAAALARQGLVECRRGTGGGCRLARTPGTVTVADVTVAVEGAVLDTPQASGLASSEMWRQTADALTAAMSVATLADLAARQSDLDAEKNTPMYFI